MRTIGVREDLQGLKWILAIFIMYVVAPLRDIPFLGLSLSAPLFGIIALELLRRGYLKTLLRTHPFRIPLVFFLASLVFSTFFNGFLSKNTDISLTRMMHLLAAYTYWVLIFFCISYILSKGNMQEASLRWIAVAVTVLAAVVIAEYALGMATAIHGKGVLTRLTQNEIGIQFSAFGLAPIAMSVVARRLWHRVAFFGGALAVGLAVVVNSSRSSWIALTLGLLVIVVLARGFRWRSQLVGMGLVGVVLIVGYLAVAPGALTGKFKARSATFQNLETDKSYQARVFLIRKAVKLFVAHPIVGVGPGTFRFHQVKGVPVPKALRSIKEKVNRISAHNAYMLMVAEGGLITMGSLVAFLGSLAFFGLRGGRLLARRGNPVGIMFLGMFVALSVHLWTLSGLGSSGAWVVYALVASVASFPIVSAVRSTVGGDPLRPGFKRPGA